MTLKEKFLPFVWFNISSFNVYQNKEKEENSKKCEKIADDYAIGFGQWMTSGVEFIDDTERCRVYCFKKNLYTTKELLEIYKKEKEL